MSETSWASQTRKAELYESLSPPAWFVVCADRERRAADDLAGSGIEAWLPECKIVVSRRRRRAVIEGPLFPGYLFVRGVMTDQWMADVMGVRDVLDFVRARSRPLAAREGQMAKLQRLVADSGGRVLIENGCVKRGYDTPDNEPLYKPGQPVRVLDGPFASFNGLVQEQAGPSRLKLMLDIFGRSTLTEMDEASVEAVA
jgi:transcription termination/antitermination protein NusG